MVNNRKQVKNGGQAAFLTFQIPQDLEKYNDLHNIMHYQIILMFKNIGNCE